MKIKLLFVAVLIILSCNDKKKESALEIYDFEGLKPFLNKKDDKVHVVNFWATWCGPCVKELPHFEELHSKYKGGDVEVLLVSLDFPHQFETKLKPFIKERNLDPKVIVLDDVDSNSWIPKISKDWSGSIPATIIYKNDKRSFYEKSFTYEELEKELNKFLN
ncbi:TlpA family protein disulfide reductase [Seonamhaeicola marinus]|uniref:TlpA family protein disulfide reductase n=1 Tax=Seonamhaeicola marinus TaxID=1912246 RepID=A0A5D0IUC1_9FLAO|nr:TlpA disulfide reductase family protein [Seonamhaeicola marinus]TYA86818.1 TlpA family protein disulfide reductase [Seonamhaeicola marinus]